MRANPGKIAFALSVVDCISGCSSSAQFVVLFSLPDAEFQKALSPWPTKT
jgi:hypothetical protein